MEMKLEAAIALSKSLPSAPERDFILPESLDKNVPTIIAQAIAE